MTRAAHPARLHIGIDGRVLDDRYHGIGRVTYELLLQLAERDGVRITLFLSSQQRSDRFDIAALTGQPAISVRAFEPSLTSITQFLHWPGVLRDAGVDVALFPYHLGASVLGQTRRMTIVHDCILEQDPAYAPDARTRMLYMLLSRRVVARVPALTPSQASATAVRRFYPRLAAAPQVIDWGVGPQFSPRGDPGPMTVAGIAIPARYYLHVGARRPHKNVGHLVRALATLAPDDHLVLVGSADPRWRDDTMQLAHELGVADRIIQLSGVTESDLMGLYARAQAFLYPSLVEGFGLPLLEAMAAGLPVVASDIPVFREIVGDAALLAAPTEPPAWTSAIATLGDAAVRTALIERGRHRAAAFTWARAADQLLAALSPR